MLEKLPSPNPCTTVALRYVNRPLTFFVDISRQYVAIINDPEPSSENSLSDSTLSATDEQRDETAGLQREGYGDSNEDTMDEEEQR